MGLRGERSQVWDDKDLQQAIVNTLVTAGGSFGVGYLVGWSFRKIIKFILIGLGVIAGIIFLALALMYKFGYVGEVRWDKMGSDIYTATNSTMTNMHIDSIQHTVGFLGLPLSAGLSIGIITGFLRG
jgi:uncharacterized membrane protein (Fun14 family)